MKKLPFFLFIILPSIVLAQQQISIKKFGAKGDAKTNDHKAFEKAADYINQARGNITLVIPKGTYIVGRQKKIEPEGRYLNDFDLLSLKGCKNVIIKGATGAKIKYEAGLKFGTFDPNSGVAYEPKMPFYNTKHAAQIGSCIKITDCEFIQIVNLELDGNLPNLTIGGKWGDTGYQLWHYGLYIRNSKNISVTKVISHHFGCDGMLLENPTSNISFNISVANSSFEYNGRQGLSWIGGNGLKANNCKFNHTGKSKILSSPGGGIDIEAEGGSQIRNGEFTNCEFINNAGGGLVANSGPSEDIRFNKCTFWGIDTWSAWVEKPNYTFTACNFYGSFVHGYVTGNYHEATKFYGCTFEDKAYNGKAPFGMFLLECDGRKLMIFDNCTFTANQKKIMWYNGKSVADNEKAILQQCIINVKTAKLADGDFYAVMRNMNIKNTIFNHSFPATKKYYLNEGGNIKQDIQFRQLSK